VPQFRPPAEELGRYRDDQRQDAAAQCLGILERQRGGGIVATSHAALLGAAGTNEEQIGTHRLNLAGHRGLAAAADRHQRNNRAHPDDHAKHRQRSP
jgi:hypothetical protein